MADYERGIAIAERLKDVQQLTRGLNNVAEAKIAGGDIQAALALYVRFRHELEQIGSPAYFRWLDVQEAAIAAAVGDWDRALELLRPALTHVETGGTHVLEGDARSTRGSIQYARGETREGVADLERGLEAARAVKDPQVLVPSLGSLADLLTREGRAHEARELLAEALTLCRDLESPYYTLALSLALPALDTDLREPLLEVFAPFGEKDVWTGVALAVWRGDRVAAAETCARCGARWQEADFRLPAAAQLRARGDVAAADEQRRLALAFYRSVGATQRIREADALLAATA